MMEAMGETEGRIPYHLALTTSHRAGQEFPPRTCQLNQHGRWTLGYLGPHPACGTSLMKRLDGSRPTCTLDPEVLLQCCKFARGLNKSYGTRSRHRQSWGGERKFHATHLELAYTSS